MRYVRVVFIVICKQNEQNFCDFTESNAASIIKNNFNFYFFKEENGWAK